MPIIVMIGPQGSGKGTQSDILAKRLGIPHVSMGRIFRAEIASGSELGKQIANIVATGYLVPTQVADQVLEERFSKEDLRNGVIFDGFPRNIEQVAALDALLARYEQKLDHVVYIHVSDEMLERRLAKRSVCTNPACQASYHLEFRPPREPGKCDLCGAPISQRLDDTPEVIRQRLQIYRDETSRLIDFYRHWGLLREVGGEQPVEQVAAAVAKAIGME